MKINGLKNFLLIVMPFIPVFAAQLPASHFPGTPSLVIEKIPGSILGLAAGDVTGDGVMDLIVAGVSNWEDVPSGLWIYYAPVKRDKNSGSVPDRVIELRDGASRPSGGVVAGDFEGDGKTDIAVHGTGRRLHVLLNHENFGVDHSHVDNNQGGGMEIAGGRMTHDKKATDLFIGPTWRRWRAGRGFDRGRAYIYPGQGLGEGSGHNRYAPVIADLNNSGSGEMIFAGSTPVIRVFYGPFTRYGAIRSPMALDYVELKTPAPARYLAVNDLNSDGRPDIIASWSDGERMAVGVFSQNSPMGFTSGASPDLVIDGISGPLLTGNLAGTGKQALVVVAQGSQGGIYVFEQKKLEGGIPSKPEDALQIIKPGKEPFQGGILSDLNSNGYPDLIVYGGETISLFLNNGGRR